MDIKSYIRDMSHRLLINEALTNWAHRTKNMGGKSIDPFRISEIIRKNLHSRLERFVNVEFSKLPHNMVYNPFGIGGQQKLIRVKTTKNNISDVGRLKRPFSIKKLRSNVASFDTESIDWILYIDRTYTPGRIICKVSVVKPSDLQVTEDRHDMWAMFDTDRHKPLIDLVI